MLLEQVASFIVALVFMFPILNKVVRLANRAFDEREFLEEGRFRQIAYITPAITIIIFIVFYGIVLTILNIILI